MNKFNTGIGIVTILAVLVGAFYISSQLGTINTTLLLQQGQERFGSYASGFNHLQPEDFLNQTTIRCARIHLAGATTNSSTTYYLMASSTFGTYGTYAVVVATSTRPTNCPV